MNENALFSFDIHTEKKNSHIWRKSEWNISIKRIGTAGGNHFRLCKSMIGSHIDVHIAAKCDSILLFVFCSPNIFTQSDMEQANRNNNNKKAAGVNPHFNRKYCSIVQVEPILLILLFSHARNNNNNCCLLSETRHDFAGVSTSTDNVNRIMDSKRTKNNNVHR